MVYESPPHQLPHRQAVQSSLQCRHFLLLVLLGFSLTIISEID